MGIELRDKSGSIKLHQAMLKGDNGGYYIPSVDADGNLTWTPSEPDMTPVEGANIKGALGTPGTPGRDGEPGKDGAPGRDGENGKDGVTPHIGSNGNWFTGDTDTGVQATGPAGKDGEPGKDGAQGDKGDKGDAFTYEDFTPEQLATLKGEKGDDGAPGKDGAIGATGEPGLEALTYDFIMGVRGAPPSSKTYSDIALTRFFNRTPVSGDSFVALFEDTLTGDIYIDTSIATKVSSDTTYWTITTVRPKLISGADGAPGTDGENGITPHIGANGNWFIGDEDTGTAATGPAGQNGNDGEPGKDGAPGADGHTPEKGVDYWTDADKTAIVNDVIAALPVYNGEVV